VKIKDIQKKKTHPQEKTGFSCSYPTHHKQEKENSSSGYKKERHCSIKMVGSAKRKLKSG